jgi:hypothetical protein
LLDATKPSSSERRRPSRVTTPSAIPSGIATSMTSANASPASHSVLGSRSAMTSDTGRPLLIDVPRSPETSPVTYAQNCSGSGRSRPSTVRRFSTSSTGA